MPSFTQRVARAGKIIGIDEPDVEPGLLVVESLTDEDRSHMWRAILPGILREIRQQLREIPGDDREMTVEQSFAWKLQTETLKEEENAALAMQIELDQQLGDIRLLVAQSKKEEIYSKPSVGV